MLAAVASLKMPLGGNGVLIIILSFELQPIMKKLLLTGIAALFLATGAAHACQD